MSTLSEAANSPIRSISATLLAGIVVVTLGLTVMFGWHVDSALLIQILPRWVPMQYNTALGFLLIGVALIALNLQRLRPVAAAGGGAAALGLLTLLQYLLGASFGIDELLMRHHITVETSDPGRMAPNTALCFFLAGSCCVLLASRASRPVLEIGGQLLGLVILTLSATASLGYLLEIEDAYGWGALTRMAPHTALGFLVIAVALIAHSASEGRGRIATVPLWLPGALFSAVFVIDVHLPLGFAISVAYVPLVFCSLWFLRPYAAVLCAASASVLIAIGYHASPAGFTELETAAVNRTLSAIAVWATAIVIYMYRAASDKLAASKARLELALDGGDLGLWDWDLITNRVLFSGRWCGMLGYEVEDLRQELTTWERLLHPEDVGLARAKVTDYLNGKSPNYESEFRMRHKNGEWRWVFARGKIVETDAAGQPSRMSGTHVDITNRRGAEEQLKLLQEAVDHSGNLVLVTTPSATDPRIVYASTTASEICGYTPEELIGRNPSILQGQARDQQALAELRSALAAGKVFDGELINYAKDGREYHLQLHVFPIRDDEGRLQHFGSIGYDITAEHRIKEALRREQAQFRSVIEFSPIGIALVAPTGQWLHVNESLCEIVGYSREELLAIDFQTITHPEDLELDLDYLGQMLTGSRKFYEMEKRYIHKSGRIVWILLTVSLVWNSDGTPSHFISQIQDITQRKDDEEKAKKYLAEVERSNRELDDFAYIASHDLREPLRGITNHSQTLARFYADRLDEKGLHKLNRIAVLTARMEKLIGDLLFFSRLGRASSALEDTDISQLIAEQVDTLSSFLRERNARVEMSNDLPRICCDRTRLATVFRNLISNAIKYNDSPEKIVSITYDAAMEVNGEVLSDVFHVRDNGIGMEADFFGDIFRMFKRLHGEKAYGEGTGAGLTFVKKIIEQQNGRIWVESRLGEGSTFHFTVPGEINEQT